MIRQIENYRQVSVSLYSCYNPNIFFIFKIQKVRENSCQVNGFSLIEVISADKFLEPFFVVCTSTVKL